MAIIVPSLGPLRGSIGGISFQNNPAGNVVRQRPRPARSSTAKQQLAHQYHQKWLYEWMQLSPSQRNDWNMYAAIHPKTNKFGIDRTITGLNWFESVNSEPFTQSATIFYDPPPHNVPPGAPTFDVVVSPTAIEIDLTEVFDFINNWLLAWCSPPTMRNSNSINQLRKKLGFVFIDYPTALDVTALWEAATGFTWAPATVFPDANIFICLQSFAKSSGISSPLLCANGTSTASELLEADNGDQLQTDDGDNLSTD